MNRAHATDSEPHRQIQKRPRDVVVIGKDVLELLSSAMYLDPLSIYREYIQNAADAIDEARVAGKLASGGGKVNLQVDQAKRSVSIRDNGAGINCEHALEVLLAIGASGKRGKGARGFRGVGRLAGLAYCRELIFRTRASLEDDVIEVRWDCVKLRAVLRDADDTDDLPAAIDKIVSVRQMPGAEGDAPHFFEVELRDIIRGLRRDALLNLDEITGYLSQVAPLPFHVSFPLGERISEFLSRFSFRPPVEISINGGSPLSRPFLGDFEAKVNLRLPYAECEFVEFSDRDGDVAAAGWIAHHPYVGALPVRARIGGVRVRCGDIQVGDDRLLDQYFPETRFNGWAIGEIHVFDQRILPNARRDNFEENVHFSDLTSKFEPLARALAKRCRDASIARNREKKVETRTRELREVVSFATPAIASRLDSYLREVQQYLEQAGGNRPESLMRALEELQREVAGVRA